MSIVVRLKHWLPAILWMAVIFSFSAVPNLKSGLATEWDVVLRKLAHVTEYAILAGLLAHGFRHSGVSRTTTLVLALVVTIVYAVSDEWHQGFVIGREASMLDVGVDAVGAVLGVVFYTTPPAWVRRWQKKFFRKTV